LIVTALVEVGIAMGLLATPSLAVELLLGTGLSSPPSLVVGRVTGAALIALGARVGWQGTATAVVRRQDWFRRHAIYNVAGPDAPDACRDRLRDARIALWPATVVHVALAIWCVTCLRSRVERSRR